MKKTPKLTKAADKVWKTHRALYEPKRERPTYMEVAVAAGMPGKSSVKYGYQRLKQLKIATRLPGAERCWHVTPYKPEKFSRKQQ